MEKMGWTYKELLETPYETYLNISRIMSLESKEELRQKKKAERKAR